MDSLSFINFIAWIVIIAILAVPGILMLLQASRESQERKRLQSWAKTTGSVISGTILEEKRSTGRIGAFGLIQRISVYIPVITYAYQVGNKDYQASRFKNAWNGVWAAQRRQPAEAVIDAYPDGKPVTVHYNPTNPGEAYLEVDAQHTGINLLRLVGLGFLAGAVVVLALGVNGIMQGWLEQYKTATIQTSAAVLSPTTSQIKTTMERDLKLTCQPEGFGGIKIAYRGWACKTNSGEVTAMVDLYARKEEPEKADLVWAIVTRANPDKDLAFLMAVVGIADPKSDQVAVQKWLAGAIPPSQQKGSRVTTTFQGIEYMVDITSIIKINFFIGSSR